MHKSPPLDVVGWWSTAPPTGPDTSHLPIHRQLLQEYNESAVFLAFHPSQVQASESQGAKLPLTVYESVLEGENAVDTSKDMQIDGEAPTLNIRFRELPYSVETGEAEMIGVDTIAKGSGTAAWNDPSTQKLAGSSKQHFNDKQQEGEQGSQTVLSQEEEESTYRSSLCYLNLSFFARLTHIKVIANLNTRLNAIRTLESRISLIKSYVSSISEFGKDDTTQLSHPILRNINSLLSHLSILSPSTQSAFSQEVLSQNNDVLLVSLLGQMGESIKAMRELGRRSAIIQSARQATTRKNPGLMQNRFEEELFAQGAFPGTGDRAGMYS